MWLYLFKSSVCLAVLLGFYKLFLESETMHVQKRFYLLAILAFAFGIPLITYTTYVEINPASISIPVTQQNPVDTNRNALSPGLILGLIYSLGVLLFGIRFIRNLTTITWQIRKNEKQWKAPFVHVLINMPDILCIELLPCLLCQFFVTTCHSA